MAKETKKQGVDKHCSKSHHMDHSTPSPKMSSLAASIILPFCNYGKAYCTNADLALIKPADILCHHLRGIAYDLEQYTAPHI